MNRAIRTVVGITASTIVVLIFAHDPTSGYWVTDTQHRARSVRVCSEVETIEFRHTLEAILIRPEQDGITREMAIKRIASSTSECRVTKDGTKIDHFEDDESYEESRPFSEWRSKDPLIWWLGSIAHLIFSVGVVMLLGAILALVFSNHRSGSNATGV